MIRWLPRLLASVPRAARQPPAACTTPLRGCGPAQGEASSSDLCATSPAASARCHTGTCHDVATAACGGGRPAPAGLTINGRSRHTKKERKKNCRTRLAWEGRAAHAFLFCTRPLPSPAELVQALNARRMQSHGQVCGMRARSRHPSWRGASCAAAAAAADDAARKRRLARSPLPPA